MTSRAIGGDGDVCVPAMTLLESIRLCQPEEIGIICAEANHLADIILKTTGSTLSVTHTIAGPWAGDARTALLAYGIAGAREHEFQSRTPTLLITSIAQRLLMALSSLSRPGHRLVQAGRRATPPGHVQSNKVLYRVPSWWGYSALHVRHAARTDLSLPDHDPSMWTPWETFDTSGSWWP